MEFATNELFVWFKIVEVSSHVGVSLQVEVSLCVENSLCMETLLQMLKVSCMEAWL
jgi:hypothetical protein